LVKEKHNNRIWLSSPTMHDEEQIFVKEAFDTNWVSTVGENINRFENEICDKVGCKYAVALTSGTAAIHMALKLAGIKQDDKVFCSDLTFAATANPILYEKCKPVFIDSEYETWNMDPVALQKAFNKYPDTKVVIAVNLYGTPAKLDEIRDICERHGAVLIEDAAESLGATYEGRQTGTFGKYNIISFNGNKIITTSGGGMLLTDDENAAAKTRKWSTQSREPYPWYQHEELGYNYRMSNILAGIGRGQLIHLDKHIEIKKDIYMRYKEGLENLPVSMNPYQNKMVPNYWLSCILMDKDCCVKPEEIRLKLEEINAEARPVWKPMHLQPIFEKYDFMTAGEEVSTDLFNRGLCLPSDIKMTEEEQYKVINERKNCF